MTTTTPAKFLVIDTETTGLFDFKQPADADGQPRLAAVGFILTAEDGAPLAALRRHVKPDGWEMSEEAFKVNGLSTEFLDQNGVPVVTVLNEYVGMIESGLIVVAFNAQYDTKVMRAELRRAGMPDLFEETPNVCVQRAMSAYKDQGLKMNRGRCSLAAALEFFEIEQGETHEALSDAEGAMALLQRLIADGNLPEAKVHYAKNQPVKPAEEVAPDVAVETEETEG